jgi:DNA-binding XRE family transcriptional regulator
MPFMETNMEQEFEELQAMINADPELREASETFNKEYEFRKKLVLARKEAGFTQKELGEISGLPFRAISRMETNAEVSPNIRTLFKYLNALGYELDIIKASNK